MKETYRFSYIKVDAAAAIAALPALYFIFNLIKMMYNQILIPFAVLAAVGVVGIVSVWQKKSGYVLTFHIYAILYIVLTCFNSLYTSNLDMLDLIGNILLVGVAGLMLTYRWNVWCGAAAFYLTFLMIAARFAGGVKNVLKISSNNYVSILLILAAALYYIPFEWNGRRMKIYDLIPAALSVALSVLAAGRGGMLTCALLFICLAYIWLRQRVRNNIQKIIVIVGLIVLAAVLIVVLDSSILNRIANLGSFGTKGVKSDSRLRIWNSYFTKAGESPMYILFGAPLKEIPLIFNRYNGNCHNSFIQLHAYSGLPSLVVTVFLTIKAFVSYIKNHQPILLSFLFIMIVRGMTDKFIFAQYGMPVMLFLILYPTLKGQTEGQSGQ